jgi:hypothetical protein
MTLWVMAFVAEVVLLTAVAVAVSRARAARAQTKRQQFELAAAEARRLAHHALILDAAIAELSELVIEQCLREMGVEVSTD